MKIAFAAIVKASNEEAELLDRLLSNVEEYVDGIFITITGENKACSDVCKKHNAIESHFDWVNDFSKARNYNFSQVPKEYDYIMWADADDMFRGMSKLRHTMEQNPADSYSMYYLYAFDENKNPVVVHHKTMIVKNDGCVEWAGALHEDFKENRNLTTYFIEGIQRLHLSNEERFAAAKVRNITVAEGQAENLPDDPRSYWNLGNSYSANNENEKAIEAFGKFLKMSQSDDEKYIVRLRMAEALWRMDKLHEAIEMAQLAIGLKPIFPDAYHLLGSLYFASNQLEKSAESYLLGLTKKPPYHSIIVFNPRDYDYVPMNNLAKVYFAMNKPQLALPLLEGCLKIYPNDKSLASIVEVMRKEADAANEVVKLVSKLRNIKRKSTLKKKLDEIPEKYQSHPMVCHLRNINFVKEESSGRDIVFFCGYTSEEWTPETARTKGIGGSEEAVINLSQRLAEMGWNVTVYNSCGHKELQFGKVTYKPFWSWNHRDKQDIVVLWRSPMLADKEINADKIIVDLHDVIKNGEFTESRLKHIYKIFVKSKFHRSLYPEIPDEKFVIVSNGINSEEFTQNIERDEKLLINTSSPDRSLRSLVDCFIEIKKQVPDAKCKWAYGWNVFDVVHGDNPKVMEWKSKLIKDMEDSGVENLGRLGHEEVNKLYQKGAIFAYPSEFAEIDCISLSKALAGGAYPITTDFSAMGDKKDDGGVYIHSEKTPDNWCLPNQHDFPLQDESKKKEFIDAVVGYLNNPKDNEKMREAAREKYSWDNVAKVWNQALK